MNLIHAIVSGPEGTRRIDRLEDWADTRSCPGTGWIHFDATHPATLEWLRTEGKLPDLIPEALTAEETRPRVTRSGEGVLVVLRGVNLNPGADPEDMVSIRLWIEKDLIISTRRRKLMSVGDALESLDARPATGADDILLRIADGLGTRINDAVNALEERVADLEDTVLTEAQKVLRGQLMDVRRQAISLRRFLSPQRDALTRLYSEPPPWFTNAERMRLRENCDRMVRVVEDLDAVRERCAVVQEELTSTLSDQLNQRMYLLSIVAALFLPLGFLTGLLGINVGGIPGADNEWAFWIFVGICGTILGVQSWIFLSRRWF